MDFEKLRNPFEKTSGKSPVSGRQANFPQRVHNLKNLEKGPLPSIKCLGAQLHIKHVQIAFENQASLTSGKLCPRDNHSVVSTQLLPLTTRAEPFQNVGHQQPGKVGGSR